MSLCIVLIWASWEVTHYSSVCMCTQTCLFLCLQCFGVDSSCSTVSEWGLLQQLHGEGWLVWNRTQLTCLPSVLQQVVTGSLGLQTSSNKDLDKWSRTSTCCWKEQLWWFIFPDLVFMIDFKVSIRIWGSNNERRWKMRRRILSRITVALLEGILLCTAGKKTTKKTNLDLWIKGQKKYQWVSKNSLIMLWIDTWDLIPFLQSSYLWFQLMLNLYPEHFPPQPKAFTRLNAEHTPCLLQLNPGLNCYQHQFKLLCFFFLLFFSWIIL